MSEVTETPEDPEARFQAVFAFLGDVEAYARRRGSADAEAIAAETMAIAWRKLADVPRDDSRPWLFATARNLVFAEWKKRPQPSDTRRVDEPQAVRLEPSAELWAIDPDLLSALRSMTGADREALLLVAWEDLSPALAAKALGISQTAFRVRLHRARRRLRRTLARVEAKPIIPHVEVERP